MKVYGSKDAAGNGRFDNIALFALNLFCLPFSNASVERVFSAMSLVKNNIRNKLLCNTVESILTVRYGLKHVNVSSVNFEPTYEMLKSFNAKIYDNDEEDDDDVYDVAFDLLNDY
uniref:HAT C-terminal dimerisation domain-containing protein n=1 Tax=Romanomermis culicivorax TaxID=13658 RepID=A0A915HVR9_ROMCU